MLTPADGTAEVIDFTAYRTAHRNRQLIEVLQTALADAQSGRIDGAILVVRRETRNHGVVVVGSYENDPARICGIAGEIFVHFMPQTPERPTIIS